LRARRRDVKTSAKGFSAIAAKPTTGLYSLFCSQLFWL
jgi:hypothetical protein